MNGANHQTNWKFIGITAGGALLLGFIFLKTFLLPWQENNRKRAALLDELENREGEFRTFLREKKRLHRDRLLGLPPQGGTKDYARYIQALFDDKETGWKVEDFQPGQDSRTVAAPGAKKALHVPHSFVIRAQGTWYELVIMLEKFQSTPLIHRVKTLTLQPHVSSDKKAKPKLSLTLTIEALEVSGSDRRPENLWGVDRGLLGLDALLAVHGQPAGWSMLLRGQALFPRPVPPGRDYSQLARVNPFYKGGLMASLDREVPQDSKNLAKKEAEKALAKAKETWAKSQLVLINTAAPEAILVPHDSEENSRIDLAPTAGKDTLPIWKNNVLKKGKLIRVDERDIYIQVDQDIYGIHIGQTLGEAMTRPLSTPELIRRGFRGKFQTRSGEGKLIQEE